MSKALRIKIIDYLRANDADTKYIDIRAHVLNDNDSVNERNELKATLDYLSNKRLIAINGSYEFLHWTASYGLYNLDNKVIATKLTKLGKAYHPENEDDAMEAAVQPVLAVIKKASVSKGEPVLAGEDVEQASPWYTEPEPEKAPENAVEELEQVLPWYTAPEDEKVPENAVAEPEQVLPWYTEREAEITPETPTAETAEQQLPWYTEPTPAAETITNTAESEISEATDKPSEETLPWYVEPATDPEIPAFKMAPDTDDLEYDELPDAQLPWHTEPKEDITSIATDEASTATPEEPLPWYTIPKEEEPAPVAKEEPLPEETERPLPWYTPPVEEVVPVAKEESLPQEAEQPLPWYTPPVKEEVVPVAKEESAPQVAEQPLPWYTPPVKEEIVPVAKEEPLPQVAEQPLPWYTPPVKEGIVPVAKGEPLPQEAEQPLPWYTPPVEEEAVPVASYKPAEAQKEEPVAATFGHKPLEESGPVIYRFPPLEPKPESVVKPAPMVIERLNNNLSSGIDAISNIKIKMEKPAVLTGDFEKNINVILKFVLIVVLFLLFGCIVWLYLG
jgi:hypothetical protein